jgi:hypothetical protein
MRRKAAHHGFTLARAHVAIENPSLAAGALFCLSAGVALWHALHVAVLWDYSYILDTAYRIAAGDIPYRDFPLLHPPGTFLVQAGLIKLFGPHYLVTIGYAALLSGLATVLTFLITHSILEGEVLKPHLIAFVLCLPLGGLGIYSVYSQPGYDPDATFLVLAGIYAVLVAHRRKFPPLACIVAGALLPLPLFVKQNMGLPYLLLSQLALLTLLFRRDRRARQGWLWFALGSAGSLAIVIGIVAGTVGLQKYLHWTVDAAAKQRLNGVTSGLSDPTYAHWDIAVWLLATFAAAGIAAATRLTIGRYRFLIVSLLSLPYISILIEWQVNSVRLGTFPHSSPIGGYLLRLWPYLIITSLAASAFTLWSIRRAEFRLLIPWIVAGVAYGSFLANGVAGSTYAVWPLLVLCTASVVATMGRAKSRISDPTDRVPMAVAVIAALSLIVAGGVYFLRNERLAYAHVESGPLHRSTIPSLQGLAIRGPYVPELDRVAEFIRSRIPSGDRFAVFPGEDPLYFALQRPPPLRVVIFDPTTNPYGPRALVDQMHQSHTRWLLIKDRYKLQLVSNDLADPKIGQSLKRGLKLVTTVGAYRVYRSP